MSQSEPKPILRLCRHIFQSGQTCRAIAMNGSIFCYWHHKAFERAKLEFDLRRESSKKPKLPILEMPFLEDASAIQVAIQEVLSALASGRVEAHRGKAILYGLQLASSNISRLSHVNASKDKTVGCLPWAAFECNLPDHEEIAKGECRTCPRATPTESAPQNQTTT